MLSPLGASQALIETIVKRSATDGYGLSGTVAIAEQRAFLLLSALFRMPCRFRILLKTMGESAMRRLGLMGVRWFSW